MNESLVADLLRPRFRQIAHDTGFQYRDMPFTSETREMWDRGAYPTLEKAFRDYLTGDLYHEYSLG